MFCFVRPGQIFIDLQFMVTKKQSFGHIGWPSNDSTFLLLIVFTVAKADKEDASNNDQYYSSSSTHKLHWQKQIWLIVVAYNTIKI